MSDNEDKPQQHIEEPKQNTEQEEEEEKAPRGLLNGILDPIGSVAGTALRPVGAVVETATKPVQKGVGGTTKPVLGPLAGEKDERMELIGGDNKDSYEHKPEKIGGGLQTGDNPLGLDETGRFGFRDENDGIGGLTK